MLTLSTKSTTKEKEEILSRIENIFFNKVIDKKLFYNKSKINLSFLFKVLLSISLLYLINVKIISFRIYIIILISPLIYLVYYFLFDNKKTVRIEDLFLKLQEEIKEENIVIEDEKYFFCFYIRFCRIKLFKDEESIPIKLTEKAANYFKTESALNMDLATIWNSIVNCNKKWEQIRNNSKKWGQNVKSLFFKSIVLFVFIYIFKSQVKYIDKKRKTWYNKKKTLKTKRKKERKWIECINCRIE